MPISSVPRNNPPFDRPRGAHYAWLMLAIRYCAFALVFAPALHAAPVVETGLTACYDNSGKIPCPHKGEAFYGQDGNFVTTPFRLRDNGNGTVSDLNTGLTWEKAHHDKRLAYYDAKRACGGLSLGGYRDWRLPNLKELFSIASFTGSQGSRFYLDTRYFDLRLPGNDIDLGREGSQHHPDMMGQTWAATLYTGDLWGRGQEAAFFFNFFDGHIKAAQTNGHFTLFYRCVRGNEYGQNDFKANGDGTVTDRATGLMWQQNDDGKGRDWKSALAYCSGLRLAGHDDWRLPDVKELQSIVDYRRSSPAIDPRFFTLRDPNGWFWSSTTHGDNIRMASYVCFGKCIAVDGTDTHGAGAQRSDPKEGDPSRWTSLGGQADQVRIYNYARCVRGGVSATHTGAGGDGPERAPGNRQGMATPSQPPAGRQPRNGPPPEALQACRGASTGDACRFSDAYRNVRGTCQERGGRLVCAPEGR